MRSDAVARANVGGLGVKSFVSGVSTPRGLAVDGRYVYWANSFFGSTTIGRANLDGSGVNQSFITGASTPRGVAVDGQHIYWANSEANTIGRANLDGSGVDQSLITGVFDPRGVAVDAQHVYWTSPDDTVGRANLDGSGVNQSFITGADGPEAVAVDGQHIYWANFTNGTIGRANLNGSNVDQTFITGAKAPAAVAVDAQHIYWTNSEFFPFGPTTTVGRANLDGSGVNQSFITDNQEPFALALTPPLGVAATKLPAAAAGVRYSTTLQANGGAAPYAWSIASGSLPKGLSLSAAGVIGGLPAAAGTSTFTVKATDSETTPVTAARSLTVTVFPAPKPQVWATNGGNSSIHAFALTATGNAPPVGMLAGSLTGLQAPDGLVMDVTGRLDVANFDANTITEYPPGASGNVAPAATIGGPATGLSTPSGVALDSSGKLYVADEAASAITVYATGAVGNAAPVQTISGPDTELGQPMGVVIDAAGHIWALNYASNSLTEYAAGANGDASPLATLAGQSTGLNAPDALAQDSNGDLFAANLFGQSITEYPKGSNGNVVPSDTIVGAASQLSFPDGADLDAAGRLYIANAFGGLNVYGVGAVGGDAPVAVINGRATGLSAPDAVAVAPPMTITTSSLPRAGIGRHYSAFLQGVLGNPPFRWRVTRGHLPGRLTLSRAGHLTGIPRRTGTSRFTVEAVDASHPALIDTRRLSITVAHPPSLTVVRPGHGRDSGGSQITIAGSRFATRSGATTVDVGNAPALDVRCRSHRRCTARTPPHDTGRVSVTVTVRGLASTRAPGAHYVYKARRK